MLFKAVHNTHPEKNFGDIKDKCFFSFWRGFCGGGGGGSGGMINMVGMIFCWIEGHLISHKVIPPNLRM